MSIRSWSNRERKHQSKGYMKNLGRPFRKSNIKDSKQTREWSKQKKRLRQLADQELEENVGE